MTDELYGGPWLCVRELLQNALDALRYRRAMFKRDLSIEWTNGEVKMAHFLNEDGEEVLRCSDNGAGMDLHQITHFLTKAGRSYYRSPEFDQQRVGFMSAGVDFDPCAQFGIGFMSCFMIGDRIRVTTCRDFGHGKEKGDPLIVEINGLGGMVVVRKGDPQQEEGTTIEIIGRNKPDFFHPWTDRVRLVPMLRGYALSTEFPIHGDCTVPEIAASVSVPAVTTTRPTHMETYKIKQHVTIDQKFSEIEPLLGGVIRTSFLTDASGNFCTDNAEAHWDMSEKQHHHGAVLNFPQGKVAAVNHENQTCLDGILVAGRAGRDGIHERLLGMVANPMMSPAGSFIVDIRGNLKPPLTPARTPPSRVRDPWGEPLWKKVQLCINLAEGRIWEQVAARCSARGEHELFWQLAMIYHAPLTSMRAKSIWAHVAVPVFHPDKQKWEWVPLPSVGVIVVSKTGGADGKLKLDNGGVINTPSGVSKWTEHEHEALLHIEELLASMSTLLSDPGDTRFALYQPADPEVAPDESEIRLDLFRQPKLLPYHGSLSKCISCHNRFRTANRAHPLATLAHEARFLRHPSDLQEFASRCTALLSEHQGLYQGFNPPNGIPLEALVQLPLQTVPLSYKFLGALFKRIDWQSVPSGYAPPYEVQLENGKRVEVTSEVLEGWAVAKPIE